MVLKEHVKDKRIKESATKAFSLGSLDEEAKTQLGIWVLLNDRGDYMDREMGK